MKKRFGHLVLTLSLLMIPGFQAMAIPITIELTNSNVDAWKSVPLFATVALSPTEDLKGVHVEVVTQNDFLAILGFGFNTDPDTLTIEVTQPSDGWSLFADKKTGYNLGEWGGFGPAGKFDYKLDGPTFKYGATSFEFYVTREGGMTPENLLERSTAGWTFVTHIANHAGVTGDAYGNFIPPEPPDDSTTPVPEPGSLALLGSGILGMALWRRHKR